MQNALVSKFISKHARAKPHPEFRPGDTIRVHVKIKEGDKERLQAFEGTVIARKNTGMGESITVRKISFGHGNTEERDGMRISEEEIKVKCVIVALDPKVRKNSTLPIMTTSKSENKTTK